MAQGRGGLALEGIRVTDLTIVLAGTGAASLLADWGAEVIRVEPLQNLQPVTRGAQAHPSPAFFEANHTWYFAYPDRIAGERPWNRYPFYHAHGKNKMSMTVDMRKPEALELIHRLVRISDIFVENAVPSTLEKLGISYEELREVKPDIIMLRMPAYGLSGPYSSYRSFGSHLEGAAGHAFLRGYPDTDPSMNEDIYYGDAVAAASGAFALATALRRLKKTGKGGLIELAQSEAVIPAFGDLLLDYQVNGRIAGPQGNDLYDAAPHNTFQCKGDDRWVAIAVGNDREWRGLLTALGEPEWGKDPRFSTQQGRFEHRKELDKHVTEWTLQYEDRWVMERLQQERVPAGVLNSDKDVLEDPQIKARGFFEEFDHPDVGTNKYPGIIWKMAKTPNSVRFPPATLGQHNDYVYKELFNISDEEYDRLVREGHIGTEYGPHVP